MKKKEFWLKKIVTPVVVLVTMISCFYTVSLMNNDDIVRAQEQQREEILLLQHAYKWIDEEDIDPLTGKLKKGVIYGIGENNSFYTSNGFQNYEINYINKNNPIDSLVEYKTKNPVININKVQERNEILFSNNFMVDFDITYDEQNLNIEKKKYDLVKTEYTQTSRKEERKRLVWKSKKVKIWFATITVYYLDWEYYTETVVETTPIETYDEVVQHVGSISLEDDANILTKLTASVVDKYFPSIRTMSTTYGIPLLIMFMDTIVKKVASVVAQILSIVADFIPILDEIKTSFETIKGYDMFTGESIGVFWRIFGGIMLVVSVVVSFVSFGAGGVAIDAATDTAQFAKKAAKLANKTDDVLDAGKKVATKLDNITSIKGLDNIKGSKLKYLNKNSDQLVKVLDSGVDPQQIGKVLEKTKNADVGKVMTRLADNADNLKSLSKNGGELAVRNISIYDDLLAQGKDANKIFDSLGDLKLNKADDLFDSTGALKGKVYKVDGDLSDLKNLDATTRGKLLDDALGNSVNDFSINGEKVFSFSDGTVMKSTPLGGSAKNCDNLVQIYDNSGNLVSKNLTSRKSMDLSKYSSKELTSKLDEYYDALSEHTDSYRYAQRTTETGLTRNLRYGEDYDKLVLELDILNPSQAKLDEIGKYISGINSDFYDIIINIIG